MITIRDKDFRVLLSGRAMTTYRLHAIKDRPPGACRHVLHVYRARADSEENAIALVRAELADRHDEQRWRVISCTETTGPAVILDRISSCTPAQAAQLKDLP